MFRHKAFFVLRGIVGAFLLLSATLKIYSMASDSEWIAQVIWAPQLLALASAIEIIVAFTLLRSRSAELSWLIATAFFVLMLPLAVYAMFVPELSCGCLGEFSNSSPDWMPILIDILIVAALIGFKPPAIRKSIVRHVQESRQNFGLAASFLPLLIPIAILVIATTPLGRQWFKDASKNHVLISNRGVVDVGTSLPSSTVTVPVTIENTSDESVAIIGGTANCNCFTLGNLPVTVNPHSSVSVTIGFKFPQQKQQNFSQRFQFFTDCGKQPVVHGVVRGSIQFASNDGNQNL